MALEIDPSVNPLAARDRSSAPSATDFRQFAALRRGAQANDPNALREVARQFESIFTKMMLDSMRSASFGDPMFGSDQGDMYQGMMDDQLAVQLSQGRGLGLADMLIRQLGGGNAGAGAGAGAAAAVTGEAGAAGSASPEQQRQFIDQVMPHATAAARELGVDPRAIVAQAALETGWGTSKPADAGGSSHNFFGIKAGAGWQGRTVSNATTEYVAGEAGTERARFRAYGSLAENVGDYVRVIRDNPRYAAALGTGADVRAFANALQRGGYATDPQYADKLLATFEKVAARQDIAAGTPADVKRFKSADATPIPAQELSNG
jgi:flagellar protein FlgJ